MVYLGTDAPTEDQPWDLRLPVAAAGMWLVVWACLAVPADAARLVALACGICAVVALGVLWFAPARTLATMVLLTAVSAGAGAWAGAQQLAAVAHSSVTEAAVAEQRAEVTVQLRGDPRPRSKATLPGQATHTVAGEVIALDGTPVESPSAVVLLVSGPQWVDLLPSQQVTTSARLVPAEDDPLTAALVLTQGEPSEITPPSTAHEIAGQARSGLQETSEVLPQPVRGLLPAVVVGDRSELDPGLAEDFRVTGMTHIMVPSGAKLAIMLGFTQGVVRLLRAPTWLQVLTGAATIAVFVLLCRPEPSVIRAAVMGGLGLLALALGRPRGGLTVLAAAVLGALLFNPELARSFGFALSVLATAGLLVLAPRWRDRWAPFLGRSLAEASAVALAAQLACYPVLVLLAPEVSLVAVPANALATPFVPVATVAGFAVAGVAALSVPVAQWLVWLAAAPVAAIALVAEQAARIPYGTVPWPGGAAGAVVLAVLLGSLLARGRWGRSVAAAAMAVLLVSLTAQVLAPPWPPRSWILVACDVDQGDGLVLSSGAGRAVVVDTGPDPITMQRCLRDLRVRQVDLLVLTHDHDDHTGGTSGALRHRETHTALAPPGFAASSTGHQLTRAGVEVHAASPGQRLQAGAWELTVLWPDMEHAPSVNDESVVIRAEWRPTQPDLSNVTVLLTGDVEEPAQQQLLHRDPNALDVDVLKTPHHGSGTQIPEFLAATRPQLTLTSLGANNPHGHPTPETWAQLTELTEHNYRTDTHGDIAVVPTRQGPSAEYRGTGAGD